MTSFQTIIYKGKPHTRIWQSNGQSVIRPCNNTSCPSRHCRSGQAFRIDEAVKGIALRFRYSTLVTFNRSTQEEALAAIKKLTAEREERFGPGTKTLGVVEKHKAAWKHPNSPSGYHAHILVLHNRRHRLRAKVTNEQDRTAHLQTLDLNRPESWNTFSPSYLLKEFVRDPQQHRSLNAGRLYYASKGFFVSEDTEDAKDRRKAAAAFYRYMTNVQEKVCAALRANCGRDKTEQYREERAAELFFSRLRHKRAEDIFKATFLIIAYDRRLETFSREQQRKIHRCFRSVWRTVFHDENLLHIHRTLSPTDLSRRRIRRLVESYFKVPNYIGSKHLPPDVFPSFTSLSDLS